MSSSMNQPASCHAASPEGAQAAGRHMPFPESVQASSCHMPLPESVHPASRHIPLPESVHPAGCHTSRPESVQAASRRADSLHMCQCSRQPCYSGVRPMCLPSASQAGNTLSCNSLLAQVCQAGLAVDDAILYLDTHPFDTTALAYYQQMRAHYHNAVQAYESQCGPLFMTDVTDGNYWAWINDPWPWEGGCI